MIMKILWSKLGPWLVLSFLILSPCLASATPRPFAGSIGSAQPENPQPSKCQISSSDQARLIEFLEQQKATRADPRCIEYAIESLGSLRASKAAPLLVDFLDFPEPLSAGQEKARMLVSSGHDGFRYKAVEALFNIGEPAVPSLTEVLRNEASPPLRLKNALAAYFAIRGEQPRDALMRLRATAAGGLCPSLLKADDQHLVAFLEDNRYRVNSGIAGCISFAALQLGMARSTRAIPTLVAYLGYEFSLGAANEMNDRGPDYPLHKQQRFPAVTSLYLIGPPSLPALLTLLKDDASPGSVRSNAIETIMLIYSEYPPEGITVIQSFAARQGTTSGSRLAEAAASAVQWCDIDHRSLCQSALKKTD